MVARDQELVDAARTPQGSCLSFVSTLNRHARESKYG